MRHAFECLDGWLDRLCRWLEQVCAVLLALACLVLLVEIVLRALFGHALLWANEFARYAVMWMVMLGSVVLAQRGGHITISVLTEGRVWLQRLSQLIAAGLCAWLAVVSVRFLLLIAPFEQVTPTLALPTVLIYSVFLLAFALMAVCFAGRALSLAKEV